MRQWLAKWPPRLLREAMTMCSCSVEASPWQPSSILAVFSQMEERVGGWRKEILWFWRIFWRKTLQGVPVGCPRLEVGFLVLGQLEGWVHAGKGFLEGWVREI